MKITISTVFFAALAFLMASLSVPCSAQVALADGAQPEFQPIRSNPIVYDIEFHAVVTPPYNCKSLKVWLPIPQSEFGQEVTEGTFESFPDAVAPQIGTEKTFGNKFAFFEFRNPRGAQIIRHQFRVKVWELHWNIDPTKIAKMQVYPASFAPFLRGETQAVVVDDRFKALQMEIVPSPSDPFHGMKSAMQWVIDEFTYNHDNCSLAASSVHGLEQRGGHCSDYHGFCSAMGRTMGYPTRMTYGTNPFPKNSPSHCKMEAYLPPYGWVSFDVSETQRLLERIAKAENLDANAKKQLAERALNRFFGGFKDNTWFVHTRGSDYELAPPAANRAAVVRTIYAEADGVALSEPDPADTTQTKFSWMTAHKYTADKEVSYPFSDIESLKK